MTTIFINEIHYDNASNDTGEFIEIAGPAGTSLTGWTLVLYNGSNNTSYATIALSGTIDSEAGGYGALTFAATGLQNGSPDGIALVNASGTVVQFLSYEGIMTAADGPAAGLTSTNIGVSQSGSEAIGSSLHLTGTGDEYADFTWSATTANTAGSVNTGQSFGGGGPTPGALSINDVTLAEGDSGTTTMTFTVTRSGGSTGAVTVDWALTLGTANALDLGGGYPTGGTLSFANGVTTQTITIPVAGDTDVEGDDALSIALSNATGGATITDASGTGTITNDDATVGGGGAFINEIHYDNSGTDANEGVEIAGAAGTSLAGWSLVFYNGGDSSTYLTSPLTGSIDDEGSGYGALWFPISNIQNGAPDAIALVDNTGAVVEFISYEGTLTALNGPAAGLTSTNIGVEQGGTDGGGLTLQRIGTGFDGEDFTWTGPVGSSEGSINSSQSFVPPAANGNLSINDVSIVEGNSGTTTMTFTVTRGPLTAGSVTVDYALDFGTGITAANAADLANVPSGTLTFADGQTSQTISVQVTGDTVGEASEVFDVVLSNATGGAVINDGTGVGTIGNDDFLSIAIYDIQGAGHSSVFLGQEVATSGVVTALTSNGFYMQDATGDGNAATSDGIFVFTSTAPTVSVGNAITLTATVSEFLQGGISSRLTMTQLQSPTNIVVTQASATLPTAVILGPNGVARPTGQIDDDGLTSFDPTTDGIDFWESIEGMRVTVENPVALDSPNSFNEFYVVASDGAGNLDATNVSSLGHVVINGSYSGNTSATNTGAGSDFNPERIQIQTNVNSGSAAPTGVSFGTELASITGVVGYGVGVYEVIATSNLVVESTPVITPEVTTLTGTATQMTIASYNVENLDPSDGAARFALLADDMVYDLGLADVYVITEVQDNDGATNSSTVSASTTLQMLVDAIFAESGVQYGWVDNTLITDDRNGGEPGGNIRVTFLYRIDRVDFIEGSLTTVTDPADQATNPLNPFYNSRLPLVGTFTFLPTMTDVTVIGNHWTSKGGSDPLMGSNQPPGNAGEGSRVEQGDAVNDYIDALLALNPATNIVVAGDMNDFQFEEPLGVLTGELDLAGGVVTPGNSVVLSNLTYLLDPSERYSYVFEGNAQQLDHILVSQGLYGQSEFDIVHFNTIGGAPNSDHDGLVARLNFGLNQIGGATPLDDVLRGTFNGDQIDGLAGNDVLLGFGGNDILIGNDGDDVLDGGAGNDNMMGGLGNDIYLVNSLSDGVTEGVGAGLDEVRATVNYTLGANVENLRLQGQAVIGTGNALDNSMFAGLGPATLYGMDGNDTLYGSGASDQLEGGNGDDLIFGRNGNDTMLGGAGNDTLRGETGSDIMDGGDGNDSLFGGLGQDTLTGGIGNDILRGEDQNDILTGGAGDDTLQGGAGIDNLYGNAGRDVFNGGAGNDNFWFDEGDFSGLTNGTADRIQDFVQGQDRIRLADIDANVNVAGDQRFTFVGTAAFTGTAGELRYVQAGGVTLILGDVDCDGVEDFAIGLTGNINILGSDFTL